VIRGRRERFKMFDSCLNDLASAIQESAVYKDFKRKRKHDLNDDVRFWNTVITTIVRKHKGVERAFRSNSEFSHVGYDSGINMLVKTLSSFDDTRLSYIQARQALDQSLSQAYSLYHSLLLLPCILTDLQAARLERAKNKYLPTPEDLNPNLRFVENLYVASVRENPEIKEYVKDNPDADPANWRDIDTLAESLLDLITSSEIYARYMESAPGDYGADAAFWREILRSVIFPSDEFNEALETQSVYWNDDLSIMSTFALKTIRRSYAAAEGENDDDEDSEQNGESNGKLVLLPKFMNKADEKFGAELFEYVVDNREKYRSYIDGFINSDQWDSERLAFMDIVVMMTAIAELIHYPSIPVPVTMNEYIEIANDYSTPRSGQFINAVLYNVVNLLNSEGVIEKKA
ncbi:MAG: transcription antitermination protein NusB, partial [Muribaculaceae bacterium]|nr:transcription antitermination protein NusB [Muribaculaceae bacterium]